MNLAVFSIVDMVVVIILSRTFFYNWSKLAVTRAVARYIATSPTLVSTRLVWYLINCLPHNLLSTMTPYSWNSNNPQNLLVRKIKINIFTSPLYNFRFHVTYGKRKHGDSWQAFSIQCLDFQVTKIFLKKIKYALTTYTFTSR